MEHRKNLNKDLRRQSGLFFQIGLLIAMMLCVSAFEYTAKKEYKPAAITSCEILDDWNPPITVNPPPKPPKPKVIPKVVEVIDEEPIETPDVTFDIIDIGEIEVPEIEGPKTELAEEVPFDIVEEMPTPVGGEAAFYKFISKNLKYPKQAQRMGVEGKVYIKFVVLENGELDRIHVYRGIGAGCDEEVVRVLEKAPKWNPGKQRGKPVKVWKIVPVNFQFN